MKDVSNNEVRSSSGKGKGKGKVHPRTCYKDP